MPVTLDVPLLVMERSGVPLDDKPMPPALMAAPLKLKLLKAEVAPIAPATLMLPKPALKLASPLPFSVELRLMLSPLAAPEVLSEMLAPLNTTAPV
jgi:hypothetical protein